MKKFILRCSALFGISILLLLKVIFFPSISYANKTIVSENITIYHQKSVAPELTKAILRGMELAKASELYNPDFTIDVCLDDGSYYTDLMRFIHGEAFAYGMADKTIIATEINPAENYALLRGRKRHLHELFAHEFLHNFQYDTFGFATLDFPFWKLEGYPEYVMTRQGAAASVPLRNEIQQLLIARKIGKRPWDWIEYSDGTGTTPIYLESRLRVQYLLEVEGLTYREIISDQRSGNSVDEEMVEWYRSR